jgi:hypothetical protein
MMHVVDTATGEKVYIKNIRSLELYFDKIKKTKDEYSLIKGDELIAIVKRHQLDHKTRSKLDSLSEFEIGKDGISRLKNRCDSGIST